MRKLLIVIICMILYNLESPPILYLIVGLGFWLEKKFFGEED